MNKYIIVMLSVFALFISTPSLSEEKEKAPKKEISWNELKKLNEAVDEIKKEREGGLDVELPNPYPYGKKCADTLCLGLGGKF